MRHHSRNLLSKHRNLFIIFGVIIVLGLAPGIKGSGTVELLPVATPTPPDPRFEQFKGACTTYGVAYGDPDDNPEDRKKVFGEPNEEANLVETSFWGFAVTVHKKVAPCLQAVERDLRDQGSRYIITELGGYRQERHDREHWFHQYGAAIDINPKANPQCLEDGSGVDELGWCDKERPYDFPDAWIETFERYGFYWGGNFRITKDYMHFEWHGEKP